MFVTTLQWWFDNHIICLRLVLPCWKHEMLLVFIHCYQWSLGGRLLPSYILWHVKIGPSFYLFIRVMFTIIVYNNQLNNLPLRKNMFLRWVCYTNSMTPRSKHTLSSISSLSQIFNSEVLLLQHILLLWSANWGEWPIEWVKPSPWMCVCSDM